MTATQAPPSQSPVDVYPAPPEQSALVLAFATTPTETQVLARWLARVPAPKARQEVLAEPDGRLEQALAETQDDPWVVPVRVAWLPREQDGRRAAGVKDLLALSNPRRPGRRAQARIVRREPDRCRVIAAEPARLSDLRERFARAPSEDGFGAFVGRQALLALARAERSVVGLQYKVPRLVVDEMSSSPQFRDRIRECARRLDRPENEVKGEAQGFLREMVASHSRLAIDAWEQFSRFLARAYSIEVDEAALTRLRALSERYPLAFLPSHRSYLDPLVLRSALHRHGFAPNHVLGGLNVGFWPIGPWARRSGVVFIRRSIREDPVYKLVLREYIGYLVRKRFNLEWYIEGGRTRTGKLRPPRYGLLNYVVEASRDVQDVMLIPTSIVYDQLYEVEDIAAQERGAQKTPESLSWLVGYARAQGRGFGEVRIQFGQPLSLREALEHAGEQAHQVERVAFELCHRINRATPITETALVTLSLLGVEDRAMTLSEVRHTLLPLLEYVRTRQLPTTGRLDLGTERGVERALAALRRHGVVRCFEGGTEPVWSIGPERHLQAAFYRNSVVHFLLGRAIAELVLVRVSELEAEGPDAVIDGWEEALRIRDLLKFEFFFARKRDFGEELRSELELLAPGWERLAKQPGAAWQALENARPLLAPRVLASFLDAYLVVAERLAGRDPELPVQKDVFVTRCLGVGEQWRLQGRLSSAESISRELFSNALKLADNRGLLNPQAAQLRERREQFADEVRALAQRVKKLRALA